jgi:hypothetical protein
MRGFNEDFTTVKIEVEVFWVVTPYSLLLLLLPNRG